MAKESDPMMRLEIAPGEFVEVTPSNAQLFTHGGDSANKQYDHVYVEVGEEDGEEDRRAGIFIFRHHSAFTALKKHLIKYKFPLHLNIAEVAVGDMEVFERVVAREELDVLEDPALGVPADWAEQYGDPPA